MLFTHFEKDGYEELVKEYYQKKLNDIFEETFLQEEVASTNFAEDDWMREIAEIKAGYLRKDFFSRKKVGRIF